MEFLDATLAFVIRFAPGNCVRKSPETQVLVQYTISRGACAIESNGILKGDFTLDLVKEVAAGLIKYPEGFSENDTDIGDWKEILRQSVSARVALPASSAASATSAVVAANRC